MVSLFSLALTFLKIGGLGFGGPFSLLAIMQKEVVERSRWLTPDEFTQSVGIGTVTPGPIFFAAAVFIGYRLRRIPGAVVAGVNLLLPSFILAVVIAMLYSQVETSAWVVAITQGIAAGVVGLFLSVVLKTGRATAKDGRGVAIVLIAFVAVVFFKVDPLLLIVVAGLAGGWLLRPRSKIQAAEK
jgi:chromate transporter